MRKAFEGALAHDVDEHPIPLGWAEIVGLRSRPSAILASSRFNPFSEEGRSRNHPQALLESLRRIGVDALLVTGGNDTTKCAMGLADMGFPVVAAPKSIDDDVSGTDTMLGFKTRSTGVRAT
nr:6-phosphofructokinase [Limnochorda pilosa]